MVEYTGNRDLETLSTFLDNGGVLPEETVDEDEDENEDFDGSKESGESDEDDDKVYIFTFTLFFLSPIDVIHPLISVPFNTAVF